MGAQNDEPLFELATRQGGPVSRAQLLGLDITRRSIARRLERGDLDLIHPGVFAVGHRAMTPHGWLMAAVLAGGPGP